MDIKKLLGGRIQELRKSKKITQERMAELIGIETGSLSNIERGKYYPTAENVGRIIEILEVEPQDLFSFRHLAPHQQLLDEMWVVLKNNEVLTRLMYKFFKSIA